MCNSSKTIGIIIRNHQYVDGKGYRVTTFGESNVRYQSCCGPMRQSDMVDYRSFSQTALQDCISVTDREALEKLYVSISEDQAMRPVQEEEDKMVYSHVDEAAVETERPPKSKVWKWLVGLGIGGAAATGIIAYVFKK